MKRLILVVVLVSLVFLAAVIAPSRAGAQPLPSVVEFHWESSGTPQSAAIPRADVAGDMWMSASEGATTTVFWVLPSGFPDTLIFVPDDGHWYVGEAPIAGDLNGDGNVNVIDAITLLQWIVGLR